MSILNALCGQCAEDARAKGFTDRPFPEFIALVHSELSEALEEFRAGKNITETYVSGVVHANHPKPEGIPTELADAVIRICHFCGVHGIDLDKAIEEKLAFNRTRPFKHGKVI